MPFGKYRGQPLDELPDGYVHWLYGLDNLREPLRSAIEREWRDRFGEPAEALPDAAVPVAEAIITGGFRLLARQHHPDHGGEHGTMVLLNQAVDWLRQVVRPRA
jgi:hypothetical protein